MMLINKNIFEEEIMKTKKVLAIIMTSLMLFSMLAACSSKQSPEDTASTTAASPGPSTAETSTKEPETTEEKVTISVAVWDQATSPQFDLVTKAFEAKYPNIDVELVDATADEYSDKVTVMLASGDSEPDVIFVKSAADEMTYYDRDQILNLDEYIARDNVDLSIYNGVAEQLQIEGNSYTLPFRLDWYLLYYNKALFDKAGVAYPSNDMTWEEYEELATKMTSGEGNEKVYGTFHQTWLNLVSNWAIQDGQHTMADGEYSFMKPTYERVLRMQENGVTQDYATLKTANIRYTSAFEQKQCAMCPMGSWLVATLIKDKAAGAFDFDWGIATIPHPDNVEAGYTVASSTPIAINVNTDQPDAAWEYVKFASSLEAAEILSENGIFSAAQSDVTREKLASVEGMPEGSKDALLVTNVVFDNPIAEKMSDIGKILEEENDLIMIGAQDTDTGIENMNTRVNQLLGK